MRELYLISIDYKTFSGDDVAIAARARSFSGQVKSYMDIMTKGFPGKKVSGGIYFVMKGEIFGVN